MRIIFAGTPEPAAVVLRRLVEGGEHEVVAVLTQPDAPRGRGRTVHPSAVAAVAAEYDLPVHKFPRLRDDAPREVLRALAADGAEAVAVVAYGTLIPADLLDVVPHGWVNLHFSLLPRWRGAAPVQAAIAAGDAVTGATTFRIEEGLDTGPVLGTVTAPVTREDTADDLLTRLTYAGRDLMVDTLTGLAEGTVVPRPQPDEGVTHAGKIRTADARIDWSRPAEVIQRTVRAHTPAPGAWTMLDGQRHKIGGVAVADPGAVGGTADATEVTAPAPGEIRVVDGRVLVGTGEGVLEVLEIQAPGKRMTDAPAWARGARALSGTSGSPARFETED